MCGRFTMATNAAALAERFHAQVAPALAGPTSNAAPSQAQLTNLNDHPQAIVRATWGFVPAWADGRPDVKPLINARAETVATTPFFRDAFKHTRCLGCRLDIFQVREKARDDPRKRILGNILGIQDRFRVQPEQGDLGKLLDLMVPDLPQQACPLGDVHRRGEGVLAFL
jgi:putative SOS response-associated peptidase YedK